MDIYTQTSSTLCSCICCKKQFSIKGIHSHYITSHTKEGNERVRKSGIKGSKLGASSTSLKFKNQKQKAIEIYILNPNKCLVCENSIPYEKRNNKCCSQSCAAIYSNKGRMPKKWTQEQKERNRIKFLSTKSKKSLKEQIQIVKTATKETEYGFSKVVYCSCSHCNTKFTSNIRKKYCSNCDEKYSHNGRAKYWFTFNVFHYPELFDLEFVKEIGFRNSNSNPNGVTRDHKISVNEAIRNNYDPYYIKHPLNCELMLFEENNKKKTKSSMSYEELISKVDAFDLTW